MSRSLSTTYVMRFAKELTRRDDESSRLNRMIASAVEELGNDVENVDVSKVITLKDKHLLIAVDSDEIGGHPELYNWLRRLYAEKERTGEDPLSGSTGALLLNSDGPLYTKRIAQYTIFHMNRLGCRFIGHPLVEAVDALQNFKTWKKVVDISLEDLLSAKCRELGKRLSDYQKF